MTSNFRTHLSHPKQTWTVHWESISERCLGLATFVVARRRDEISPREQKGNRAAGRSLGPEGRGANRPYYCVVAENDSSWNILQMEVLKPSTHALRYAPNACCTVQNPSQCTPLEVAWLDREDTGIEFWSPPSPLTSCVAMGSL